MRVSLKVYVPAIILRVCCYKEIFHNFTHCFDTYPKLLFYSIDNIKFATLKGVFFMDPRDYEREQERKEEYENRQQRYDQRPGFPFGKWASFLDCGLRKYGRLLNWTNPRFGRCCWEHCSSCLTRHRR